LFSVRRPGSWLSRKQDQHRAITNEAYWGQWAAGNDTPFGTRADVTVNRDTSLGVATVWACVSLIADAVAAMPLQAFNRVGEHDREPLNPPPRWLVQPNEEQTRFEWVFQQLVSLLMAGTSYVYTPRDAAGNVTEVWNVDPRVVIPRRETVGGRRRLVYYVYPQHAVGPIALTPPDDFKDHIRLGPLDMFHTIAFAQPGYLIGVPPLEIAREMIGSAIASQAMGAQFYRQGMTSSGVIEYPDDLQPDQAKELKEDFAKLSGGWRNVGIPPVLTGGASFKQITITPEQAQFLESRNFSVLEIARWFRVPPHLVGDMERTTSWGSGMEQNNIAFANYTIRPWIERLEQAYNRNLLLFQPDAFTRFDMTSLMRGDAKARADYYASGRIHGWLNGDTISAQEGLPSPLPDGAGEKYWMPANMIEIGEPRPPQIGGPPPSVPGESPDEGSQTVSGKTTGE